MGTYNIGAQPQQLFPFGEQEPMVIKNNGPYTIYADSDSSIDQNSHPIPPTGTLAWDGQRPLWLCADALAGTAISTVSVVRNSATAAFGNETDNVLWTANRETGTANGAYVADTRLIDASAYNTLRFMLHVGWVANGAYIDGDTITGQRSFAVAVAWYDASQNYLGTDNYTVPFPFVGEPFMAALGYNLIADWNFNVTDSTSSSRINVPVKGTYFKARIQSDTQFSTVQFTGTIVGMTRVLPERISWANYDGLPHLGGGGGALIPFSTFSERGWSTETFGGGGIGVATPYNDIYIPPVTDTVQLTFRWTTATTVAGLLGITSAYTTGASYDQDIPIPVAAAGTSQRTIIRIPTTTPTRLTWRNIPQSAGPVALVNLRMSLLYLS